MPGRGGEPVGDLALHHHAPELDLGQLLDRLQDRRHGDAVGKVRDDLGRQRVERRRGRRPSRRRSASVGVRRGRERLVAARARAARRSRPRAGARTRGARYALSTPRPPPISSTTSSASSSAVRPITPRMLSSTRKFWPSSRFGPDAEAARGARGSRGPRSPAEEPGGVGVEQSAPSPRRRCRAARPGSAAVAVTYAGSFGLPRRSCGERNGASVSASSSSSGHRARPPAAGRSPSDR